MPRLAQFIVLTLFSFLPLIAPAEEEALNIGAIFSLSGWAAEGGQADLDGALLAVDDINSAGGVSQKQLKLLVEDSQSDLRGAASAFRKLAAEGNVAGVVGPNWAEFLEVIAPFAEESRIPIISPSGYKDGLFEGKKYTFTLWPRHYVATKPLSDFIIAGKLSPMSVLIVENAYYDGVLKALIEQLKGSEVVIREILHFSQPENDYRSIITKLKKSGDKAVLLLLVENQGFGSFIKQARELRLPTQLLASNTPSFDELAIKSPGMLDGMVFYDFVIPGGDAFAERFRTRFKRSPGFASAKAYDAVFLIKDAVERCGASPEKVSQCLRSTRLKGLSGLIEFNEDGVIKTAESNSYLIRMKDGRRERMTPERQ